MWKLKVRNADTYYPYHVAGFFTVTQIEQSVIATRVVSISKLKMRILLTCAVHNVGISYRGREWKSNCGLGPLHQDRDFSRYLGLGLKSKAIRCTIFP